VQTNRIRKLLLAALMAGVAGSMSVSTALADNVKIGFIVKFPGGFFDTLQDGGRKFAAAHPDVEIIFGQATSGTDAPGEIALIESMITQGVQGIAITPIDPSVIPALDAAVAAGIKVVLMDNDLPDWKNKTSVVATDNFAGGKLAGQFLAKLVPAGSKVGMIAGVPGVPALDDRLEGMQEGMGAGYTFVGGNFATKCQQELGVKATEDMLTANPDIKAIFGACDGPTVGGTLAIESAGIKAGDITVVGFDGQPEAFAAITAGTMVATVVQYPAHIGEYGVETLYKALKGEAVPAFVDTGTGLATKDNLADFQ
jgi:ABC-type sugar transport system substrate-binding protein